MEGWHRGERRAIAEPSHRWRRASQLTPAEPDANNGPGFLHMSGCYQFIARHTRVLSARSQVYIPSVVLPLINQFSDITSYK